jgi:hypothetical protein
MWIWRSNIGGSGEATWRRKTDVSMCDLEKQKRRIPSNLLHWFHWATKNNMKADEEGEKKEISHSSNPFGSTWARFEKGGGGFAWGLRASESLSKTMWHGRIGGGEEDCGNGEQREEKMTVVVDSGGGGRHGVT